MGLENVKQEILSEAEGSAVAIAAQAERKRVDIEQKALEEVHQYRKEAEEHAAEMLKAMERKMLAAATFDAQRQVLNTKKQALEAVLNAAREHFASMNAGERKKCLQSLLKKASAEIDVAIVYVNKNDLNSLTGRFNVKSAEIIGGLIAENKDGSISINLSVDELLETARDKNMVKLSEVLFGND